MILKRHQFIYLFLLSLLGINPFVPRAWAAKNTIPEDLDVGHLPMVSVLYGTDRARASHSEMFDGIGGMSPDIHYGQCRVVLDEHYRRRAKEKVSWLGFLPKAMATGPDVQSKALSKREFDRLLSTDQGKGTFVFIHGFNTGFHNGAVRAAQIAYDLQLPGTPMMYCWPSQGNAAGFQPDIRAVENPTVKRHCETFLEEVLEGSAGAKVHLVAHSLGARLLCEVLPSLSPSDVRRIGSIILIAPEIAAGDFKEQFEKKGGLREKYVEKGCPILVYASSEDKAMKAAQVIEGKTRLGQAGADLTVLRGLTTIDASQISVDCGLCHNLDDRDGVINDMYLFLHEGLPPERRLLTPRPLGGLTYYEIFDGVHEIRLAGDYNWAVAEQLRELTDTFKIGLFTHHPLQAWLGITRGFLPTELELRYSFLNGNWRPYLEAGFDYYVPRDSDTSVTAGAFRYGLGLEYVWDSGWGLGCGLDAVQELWHTGTLENDRTLDDLMKNEDFPWNQIHIQLTRYFDFRI